MVLANDRSGSWSCENQLADRSRARLIQTECLLRTKESQTLRVRFFVASGRLLPAFSHSQGQNQTPLISGGVAVDREGLIPIQESRHATSLISDM